MPHTKHLTSCVCKSELLMKHSALKQCLHISKHSVCRTTQPILPPHLLPSRFPADVKVAVVQYLKQRDTSNPGQGTSSTRGRCTAFDHPLCFKFSGGTQCGCKHRPLPAYASFPQRSQRRTVSLLLPWPLCHPLCRHGGTGEGGSVDPRPAIAIDR